MTKTLEDVKADMSVLYEELRNGQRGTRSSSVLANIAGKYLKAAALTIEEKKLEAEYDKGEE